MDTLSNVTTVGALNAGSITSGFGAIDNGSSAITTTGTITYGSLSDGSITINYHTLHGIFKKSNLVTSQFFCHR